MQQLSLFREKKKLMERQKLQNDDSKHIDGDDSKHIDSEVVSSESSLPLLPNTIKLDYSQVFFFKNNQQNKREF